MADSAVKIPFIEAAAPSTPAANRVVIYCKADGLMYSKDDAGTETLMSSGGAGSVATDPIWDAAGDLAVGTGSNTAARMAMGAAGGAVSRVNGAVAWNSGTSNPTAATGDRYWRTDLGMEVYYDGTRWLTTQLFREPFATELSALPAHSGNDTVGRLPVWHTTWDMWLVAFYSSTRVGTTNNGTNFWSVGLNRVDAANSSSSVVSFSTGTTPDAADTWITRSTAIGASLASATYKLLKVDLTKTLNPGTIFVVSSVSYRLIVT